MLYFQQYHSSENILGAKYVNITMCLPVNLSPGVDFLKAHTVLQDMSQILNVQVGTCKRITPVNSS